MIEPNSNPNPKPKFSINQIVIVLALIISAFASYKIEASREKFEKIFVISSHKFPNGKKQVGMKSDDFLKLLEREDCWFAYHEHNKKQSLFGSTFACVTGNRTFKAASQEIAEKRHLRNATTVMSKEDLAERSAIISMGYDAYCKAYSDSKFCTKK